MLFVKRTRGKARSQVQFWRIPAEGGEPTPLDVTIDDLWGLRLHPDGRRIAFGTQENKSEVWVMENFLPPPKAAQR